MSDEYIYVDTATNGLYNRNKVTTLADYNPPAGASDCFATYLLFTADLRDYTCKNISPKTGKPSVSGYPGPALAEYVPFDFDSKADPEKALAEAAHFVRLWEKNWGLPPEALRVYFSGLKGVSIEAPALLFGGFEPHANIAHDLRKLATRMTPGANTLDTSIYEKLRLWRVPNTQHGGSGLYKVPLKPQDLSMELLEIKELASTPRSVEHEAVTDLVPMPGLVKLYALAISEECKPISNGVRLPEGRIPERHRNSRLCSLAGSMRRKGMCEEAIFAALIVENKKRCDPPLSEDEVDDIAQSIGRYETEDPYYAPTSKPPRTRAGRVKVYARRKGGVSID